MDEARAMAKTIAANGPIAVRYALESALVGRSLPIGEALKEELKDGGYLEDPAAGIDGMASWISDDPSAAMGQAGQFPVFGLGGNGDYGTSWGARVRSGGTTTRIRGWRSRPRRSRSPVSRRPWFAVPRVACPSKIPWCSTPGPAG